MADQEKKAFETESLEVAELEDEDLEGVAGGVGEPVNNTGCPTTINNSCGPQQPQLPQSPQS